MRRYVKTADGSFETMDGKVLFFSIDRFVSEIGRGECCFICGADPSEKAFNDEHVLPRWLLAKHDLYDKKVTLPNGQQIRYAQYTIPCCSECNAFMGDKLEKPVQEILEGGHHSVADYLNANGHWLFFVWLSLIFLKTHLKDRHLRFHLDRRLGEEPIADLYAWEQLHHIHCVARSFFTRGILEREVSGSFLTLHADTQPQYEHFDYRDVHDARTILLRSGETAFVAVLNDSCASSNLFRNLFDRLGSHMSPLQLREVLAHLSYLNQHLAERPTFHSEFTDGEYRLRARLPAELRLEDTSESGFGRVLYACCEDILNQCENPDVDQTICLVKQGKYTFLFDSNGEFLANSMEFPE